MKERTLLNGIGWFAVIAGAGLFLYGATGEIGPLLAAPLLAFLRKGKLAGLAATIACAVAAAVVAIVIGLPASSPLQLALFLATAIAIGLVVDRLQIAARDDSAVQRTHAIAESMPGIGWATDADGRLTYITQSAWNFIGENSRHLVVSSDTFAWQRLVHPDDIDRVAAMWRRSLQTGDIYELEYRFLRFDGVYRWVHVIGRPARDSLGNITAWYGTTFDVEDRKRAEENLRRAEKELRTTLDTIPALVVSSWPDGTVDFFNAYWGLQGFSADELRCGPFGLIHPDDAGAFSEKWQRSLETGDAYEFETRLRKANGEYRWYLTRAATLRDDEGGTVKRYAIATDIDDRKKAEEVLRMREREILMVLDTIPALVWSISADGKPEYINKRLEAYYGHPVSDSNTDEGTPLDHALELLMHPDDLLAVREALRKSLQSGQPFLMRYRTLRADGKYRWVDNRAEAFRDEHGRIRKWYGVIFDIDDEKRAQEALRTAQNKLSRATQLASLAELSASIAHEVNQPLAALIANSHACQRWLMAEPANLQRARVAAERIVRDANGAAGVIRRVRALFNQKFPARTFVNLNELIREVCQLLIDEGKSKGVLIECRLDSDLPLVWADRVQIQQVVANLIRNGMDAAKGSEDIHKFVSISSSCGGDGAITVEVRDNGAGISQPDRIFEPFFTTKEEGMGMGLAICRSILDAHEGHISADSLAPHGTIMSFTLPIRLSEPAS